MHYWGLPAIAERLGLKHHEAVLRLYRHAGLPIWKRRRGSHPRLVWYSYETLLVAWQLAQCKAQRDRMVGLNSGNGQTQPLVAKHRQHSRR